MKPDKQWKKPQLVVLGRGTEEEAVLQACKHTNPLGGQNPNRCRRRQEPGNPATPWVYCNAFRPS